MSRIHCSQEECEESIGGNKWDKIRAHPEWFQEAVGKFWCQEHTPEWVAAWRERNKE